MRTAKHRAPVHRPRHVVRVAAVAAGALAFAGLGMSSAHAVVTVTVAAPAAVTVGSTDTMTITLTTDGADSVAAVNVLPSCGGLVGGPPLSCSTPDLGVFDLAVDTAASTCDDGGSFLGLGGEAPNGVRTISAFPAIAVPAGPGCTIVLERTALRLPTSDVSGNPGVQTNIGASAVVLNLGAETVATAIFSTVNPGPPPPPPSGSGTGTCNGLPTTINGGSGNQDLQGTAGDDVVNLGSGNDSFVGNGGNDVVCGGSGNDTITTGDGNDTIFAGSGDDEVDAGGGTNSVDMGSGN